MNNAERLEIINKVKTGELSVEEAARRLKYLDSSSDMGSIGLADTAPSPTNRTLPDAIDEEVSLPDLGWWRNAWLIPLGIGIFIFILSAILLSWGYINDRLFWFYCSWLPLLLGLVVLMLGVWSRQARWAHVRINSSDGTRIAVSAPLPTRFAGWVLRILMPRIPALREKNLDSLLIALDGLEQSHDPIFVDVDDEGGDQVRVYIL